MHIEPTSGANDLVTRIVAGIADALGDRPGESVTQKAVRLQAATATIMEFRPNDAVEAMFAAHCVLFHELIVDNVQGTLLGEEPATRRDARSGIVAMDRAFGANLTRLWRYRALQAKGQAETLPAGSLGETEIADRVRRHQQRTPTPAVTRIPGDPLSEIAAAPPQGPDQTAASDQPGEARLAAATAHFAGLNRQARREIGRQAHKRLDAVLAATAAARRDVTATRNEPTPKASATAAD